MSKRYRLGVASLVHDHIWGELKHWKSLPNVDIVAAGDVNSDLREKIKSLYSVPTVYNSWQEMVEKEDLDVIQATSENSVAADIVEACAARGIHVITEKPMAATLSQAERMVAAAHKSGIRLMVNWPTAWNPAIQEMERRIEAGEIGRLTYFKQRSAHNGPKEIGCDPHFVEWLYDEEKNGAGALMDYCCYSAGMCARFLGLPQQVTGFRGVFVKDYPLPDDNAIILMKYERAFGVAEASWTQTVGCASANPVAYGTDGSIAVVGGKVEVVKTGGERQTIEPAATTAPRRSGPEYFIHCIETGEPITGFCSMETSRDAQEILEAGKRAADTGQTQTLPLTA